MLAHEHRWTVDAAEAARRVGDRMRARHVLIVVVLAVLLAPIGDRGRTDHQGASR